MKAIKGSFTRRGGEEMEEKLGPISTVPDGQFTFFNLLSPRGGTGKQIVLHFSSQKPPNNT